MSETKPVRKTTVDLVAIQRHEGPMMLPEGVSMEKAIEVLQRQVKMEEEVIDINEEIIGVVWDCALAFQRACAQLFGFVGHNTYEVQTFFGGMKVKPELIAIEVAYGETEQVPVGRFTLPGIGDGFVEITPGRNNYSMNIHASVKRKYQGVIDEIADETRRQLARESIYRGKAFKLEQVIIQRPWGKTLEAKITFLDISQVNPKKLIFSKHIDAQIRTNLFTPIVNTNACRVAKIPLKRGVVLAGKYGVGKTMAAYVTAKLATDNNWTFIYCQDKDLASTINMAKMYQPVVVFCEDIDRQATTQRDDNTNIILNTLDSIEGKDSQVMAVFTTNHPEKINAAMYRPGRLDAVITVDPPDAEACIRLVREYAGDLLAESEDLTEIGGILNGEIPAIIREVVERSKLYAIYLTGEAILTSQALLEASVQVKSQLARVTPAKPDDRSPMEVFGDRFAAGVIGGFSHMTQTAGKGRNAVINVLDEEGHTHGSMVLDLTTDTAKLTSSEETPE